MTKNHVIQIGKRIPHSIFEGMCKVCDEIDEENKKDNPHRRKVKGLGSLVTDYLISNNPNFWQDTISGILSPRGINIPQEDYDSINPK